MTRTLQGHVAVISGALGDIGRAIALELAARGADIALGDVLPHEAAEQTIGSIQKLGQRTRYDRVDVTDADAVDAWIRGVEESLGIATLIIPNAATVTLEGIRTVTPTQWRRELTVNLDGAFHLAQVGSLRLLEHGREGRIVFIGSWAAHAPHQNIPAYSVAKAGLRMLCQCMALDLAPQGILVNEVAPGYVDAGLSGKIFDSNPELRRQAAQQVPIHQLITAEEVAYQVGHLCDPANRHMTGATVVMDGGLSLLARLGQLDEST